MSDILVTVPLAFALSRWVEEGDPAGSEWSGQEWGFRIAGARPSIEVGERVYICHAGRLRGYAPLIRVEPLGPYYWSLVRGGGAVAVTIGKPIPGFRGWRKRFWKYEDERPFPEWRIP